MNLPAFQNLVVIRCGAVVPSQDLSDDRNFREGEVLAVKLAGLGLTVYGVAAVYSYKCSSADVSVRKKYISCSRVIRGCCNRISFNEQDLEFVDLNVIVILGYIKGNGSIVRNTREYNVKLYFVREAAVRERVSNLALSVVSIVYCDNGIFVI